MKEEVLNLQSTVSNIHGPGYGYTNGKNGKGKIEDDQSEWARQEQQVRAHSLLYNCTFSITTCACLMVTCHLPLRALGACYSDEALVASDGITGIMASPYSLFVGIDTLELN